MKNITIRVLDFDGFIKAVYNQGGEPIDKTIFDRIKFLSYSDFSYTQEVIKGYYVLLYDKDKIIGVSKQGYFSLSARNENVWSISYLSIDKDYQGMGLSRILIDRVFKEAKERGYEIGTSSYSKIGKERIKKLFNEYASKYEVVFYDKKEEDYTID